MERGRDPWLCLPDGNQLWFAASVPICTASESSWRSKTTLAFIWDWWSFSAAQIHLKLPAENHNKWTGGLLEMWWEGSTGWYSIFSIHIMSYQWQGMNSPVGFSTFSKGVECSRIWIGEVPTIARWSQGSALLFCFIIWNWAGRVHDWQIPGFSAWFSKEGTLFVCSPQITLISVSHFICVQTRTGLPFMKILKGSASIKSLQI